MVSIIDVTKQGLRLLESANIPNPILDSRLILSFVTDLSKEEIIFNPDRQITSEQEEQFFSLIQRRSNREPLSHLIGNREFFGHNFIVSNQVLDPRPDSEILVELVNAYAKDLKDQNFNILELGPGSGCLIITILKSNPRAKGVAAEISQEAIKICKQNITKFSLEDRLNLIHSDLFTKIDNSQKFDFIISNPPYIPSKEIDTLQDEVRLFEPKQALNGGSDGLDFYKRIASSSASYLNPGGQIIVEIGQGQEDQIEKIFKSNNLHLKESKKDLAGIVRVLSFTQ